MPSTASSDTSSSDNMRSLLAVTMETGTGFLCAVIPLQWLWEIRRLSHRSKELHGPQIARGAPVAPPQRCSGVMYKISTASRAFRFFFCNLKEQSDLECKESFNTGIFLLSFVTV